jgi:hypothetical protein
MRWIGRKFFGIDPDAPPESLDDPTPSHAKHTMQAVPSASSTDDLDFPIDTDVVIPNVVKPSHRE